MVREFAVALVAGIARRPADLAHRRPRGALDGEPGGSPAAAAGRRRGRSARAGRRRGAGARCRRPVRRARRTRRPRSASAPRAWRGRWRRDPAARPRPRRRDACSRVTGWVAGTGTKVVSDIRELVPADLPALQSVDALAERHRRLQELDVIVSGDVTSPAAIELDERLQAARSRRARLQRPSPRTACARRRAELCPGPALSDLFDLSSGRTADAGRGSTASSRSCRRTSLQAILSRPKGKTSPTSRF